MAGATGLEPAASCVTVRRSNQLNYRPTNCLQMTSPSQAVVSADLHRHSSDSAAFIGFTTGNQFHVDLRKQTISPQGK